MSALKHPAEESAERLKNGNVETSMLNKRDRAELKYIILSVAGEDALAWDMDKIQDEVFEGEGSATVSKDELVSLAEFVAECRALAESEGSE